MAWGTSGKENRSAAAGTQAARASTSLAATPGSAMHGTPAQTHHHSAFSASSQSSSVSSTQQPASGQHLPSLAQRFLDALMRPTAQEVADAAGEIGRSLGGAAMDAVQRQGAIDGLIESIALRSQVFNTTDAGTNAALIGGWVRSVTQPDSLGEDEVFEQVLDRIFIKDLGFDEETPEDFHAECLSQHMTQACLSAAGGSAMAAGRLQRLLNSAIKCPGEVPANDWRHGYDGSDYQHLAEQIVKALETTQASAPAAALQVAGHLLGRDAASDADVLAHLFIGLTDRQNLGHHDVDEWLLGAQHCPMAPTPDNERIAIHLDFAKAIGVDMAAIVSYLMSRAQVLSADDQMLLLTCMLAAREELCQGLISLQSERLDEYLCLALAALSDKCSPDETMDLAARYARCTRSKPDYVVVGDYVVVSDSDDDGEAAAISGSPRLDSKSGELTQSASPLAKDLPATPRATPGFKTDPLALVDVPGLTSTEILARLEEAYLVPGALDEATLKSHCRRICEELDAPPALRSAMLVTLFTQGARHVTPALLVQARRFIVAQLIDPAADSPVAGGILARLRSGLALRAARWVQRSDHKAVNSGTTQARQTGAGSDRSAWPQPHTT
jgi:hypothetical protein